LLHAEVSKKDQGDGKVIEEVAKFLGDEAVKLGSKMLKLG